MTSHQTNNVFTRLPPDRLRGILATAPSIAAANGCVMLGTETRMQHITLPGSGRLQAVVTDKAGKQISPMGKYGGTRILVKGRSTKSFHSPEHVFRDGVDSTMNGKEKQVFYLEAIDNDPDSVAAMKQLKDLWDTASKSPKSWANAVADCPDHKALLSLKTKNPTKAAIVKHAQTMIDRGNVFFPVARSDEDDSLALKFSNKIRQEKRQYKPAKGSGFDIDIVDEYFKSDTNAGLRLVSFLGRDGTEWQGRQADIKAVHAGFFIITVYPDYYVDTIKKITTPHRLETIVCLDCDTASASGLRFTMPNLQELAGMPAEDADKGGAMDIAMAKAADNFKDTLDDDEDDGDTAQLLKARKRQKIDAGDSA